MTRTITAIRAQQRRRDRTSIYLDHEYAFGLQRVLAARLHVGDELLPEDIAALKRADDAERAYEAVLRYLSYRPRSRREVEQYLTKRQVPEDQVDEILERLLRSHLVDDEAFARFWVENREAFRPRSQWALRQELYAKGVDRDVIDRMVQNVDEDQGAMQVATDRSRRYARLDKETFTRRLLGVLQRKGYRYHIAAPAVAEAWRQLHDENDADTEDD